MTIDEKLTHFYDVSVEAARAQASASIEEHKRSLAKMQKEHETRSINDAQAQIKAETENARREVNKALSAQQLTIKRDWTKKQNELKEKLFVEVKDKLEQFTATPPYADYLCKKIEEAREFAGEDELYIYLSPEDSSLLQQLINRTGFPLQIAKESFIGGIKAMIPGKNILIDHSFLGNYETIHKQFQFDGGLKK